MTILAGSTGGGSATKGALILIAIIAFCVGSWLVDRWLHPYTVCPRCEGTGRNPGSSWTFWGYCRRCGGSGRRERFSVRLARRRDQ